MTLKAKRIIDDADVIIYADSLVPVEIADFAKPGAAGVRQQGDVSARNHGRHAAGGDRGQDGGPHPERRPVAVRCDAGTDADNGSAKQVDYEIIPGVSAAFAAAAVLKAELTVPEVSQTVIMTRAEGRVPMPEGEDLISLARHGSTLVIFLSVTRMFRIANQLQEAGYPADTPVAVAYRVGWPDEQIIRGTLADIAQEVRDAKITLQALIIVGKAVDPNLLDPEAGEQVAVSHLYSDEYTPPVPPRRTGFDHVEADRDRTLRGRRIRSAAGARGPHVHRR